jgi:hypothetical protein
MSASAPGPGTALPIRNVPKPSMVVVLFRLSRYLI